MFFFGKKGWWGAKISYFDEVYSTPLVKLQVRKSIPIKSKRKDKTREQEK